MTATTAEPLVALLGNPNCGKTALFNLLTGSRQKVANYAGVTVERKEGRLALADGRQLRLLDLPGAYSLNAESEDEAITRAVILGQQAGETVPDLLLCVTDATQLRLNLRLVLEVRELGLPMVLVLNMSDQARKRGFAIDAERLSEALGVPVVETVGIRRGGADGLLAELARLPAVRAGIQPREWQPSTLEQIVATHEQVRKLLDDCVQAPAGEGRWDEHIDKLVLHPALVFVGLYVLFPADPFKASVVVSAAALPVAGNVFILAQHYKIAPHRVSASILISTAVSILTVSLVIAWVTGS